MFATATEDKVDHNLTRILRLGIQIVIAKRKPQRQALAVKGLGTETCVHSCEAQIWYLGSWPCK
jgi:hypothetical protein